MFLVGCKTPLQSFLGIAEQHGGPQNGVSVCRGTSVWKGTDGDQEEASCVDLLSFHNAKALSAPQWWGVGQGRQIWGL